MDTESREPNGAMNPDVQAWLEKNSAKDRKWKKIVISVVSLLALLTAWAGYLIINGSLSYFENPLSFNILDDIAILCIMWFIGVFIALAHKLGILGLGIKLKKEVIEPLSEPEVIPVTEEKKGVMRKYILPGLTMFVLIPVISAVILYYIIYFIVFLFLGVLPYLVGIAMAAGLVYSLFRLIRLLKVKKRGRSILAFSTLMILCYVLVIFMMYEFNPRTTKNQPVEEQKLEVPIQRDTIPTF